LKKINLKLKRHSNTKILTGNFSLLLNQFPNRRRIIVIEENVYTLYRKKLPDLPTIVLGSGETLKNLDTVAEICEALLELDCDRQSLIIAIGGGSLTDVAGFTASVYLRGIKFGFIPTTLLALADASIGGKNSINFKNYKNMIGTITQPEFVICDTRFLKSQDDQEFYSGLAEVIKHALINSPDLWEYLKENIDLIKARNKRTLEEIIFKSIKIKTNIVKADETELDSRRLLNLGHTFGHAIEISEMIPHGHAVVKGIHLSMLISLHTGYLSTEDYHRIKNLLELFGYELKTKIDNEKLLSIIKKDKKRNMDSIYFVFLKGIGQAFSQSLPFNSLENILNDLRIDN